MFVTPLEHPTRKKSKLMRNTMRLAKYNQMKWIELSQYSKWKYQICITVDIYVNMREKRTLGKLHARKYKSNSIFPIKNKKQANVVILYDYAGEI